MLLPVAVGVAVAFAVVAVGPLTWIPSLLGLPSTSGRKRKRRRCCK